MNQRDKLEVVDSSLDSFSFRSIARCIFGLAVTIVKSNLALETKLIYFDWDKADRFCVCVSALFSLHIDF